MSSESLAVVPALKQVAPSRCLAIMPAFNESGSVGDVVKALHDALPDVDVVVIDDGSTDGTPRVVPEGATVLSLPFNLGIGGAMQTGYRYAARHGYQYAVQVDADGQHPPALIQTLRARMEETGADMVVGSRFVAKTDYEMPVPRWVGMRMLANLIRLLTGKRFTDVTSGFRLANQHVIRAFAHWYPDDYPEPEVLLLLSRAGFQIDEASVQMEERAAGETSIPFTKGLFYVVKVGFALILGMFRDPWPKGKWEY